MSERIASPRRQAIYFPGNSGVEPPASLVQKGSVSIVAGTQSYDIVFSPAFAAAPASFLPTVQMPNSSGESFGVNSDKSTLTANGVTVWLTGIPTSASTGGYINWRAEL